jgi:predicted RNase H-like HicB family nuclease
MNIEINGYKAVVYELTKELGGGWLAETEFGLYGDGNTPDEAVADLKKVIDEWEEVKAGVISKEERK